MGDEREKSRYAWHACWHDDAWRGIELMPPDVVGVYWRIILLMYRRRSALPDDDATLAKVCLTSIKQYRRAKRVLMEAQRIEVDDENGLLYCTRAVRQLVRDDRYRESQGRRGKNGGRPSLAVDNVAMFPTELHRTSSRDGGQVSAELPGDKQALDIENIQKRKTPEKATHTHKEKESSLAKSGAVSAARKRAALPPDGGGAPNRRAWLEAQARGLGLTPQEGKDDGSDGSAGASKQKLARRREQTQGRKKKGRR